MGDTSKITPRQMLEDYVANNSIHSTVRPSKRQVARRGRSSLSPGNRYINTTDGLRPKKSARTLTKPEGRSTRAGIESRKRHASEVTPRTLLDEYLQSHDSIHETTRKKNRSRLDRTLDNQVDAAAQHSVSPNKSLNKSVSSLRKKATLKNFFTNYQDTKFTPRNMIETMIKEAEEETPLLRTRADRRLSVASPVMPGRGKDRSLHEATFSISASAPSPHVSRRLKRQTRTKTRASTFSVPDIETVKHKVLDPLSNISRTSKPGDESSSPGYSGDVETADDSEDVDTPDIRDSERRRKSTRRSGQDHISPGKQDHLTEQNSAHQSSELSSKLQRQSAKSRDKLSINHSSSMQDTCVHEANSLQDQESPSRQPTRLAQQQSRLDAEIEDEASNKTHSMRGGISFSNEASELSNRDISMGVKLGHSTFEIQDDELAGPSSKQNTSHSRKDFEESLSRKSRFRQSETEAISIVHPYNYTEKISGRYNQDESDEDNDRNQLGTETAARSRNLEDADERMPRPDREEEDRDSGEDVQDISNDENSGLNQADADNAEDDVAAEDAAEPIPDEYQSEEDRSSGLSMRRRQSGAATVSSMYTSTTNKTDVPPAGYVPLKTPVLKPRVTQGNQPFHTPDLLRNSHQDAVQLQKERVAKQAKVRKPRSPRTAGPPRMPSSLTRSMFKHFSSCKVTKEALDEVEKVADKFWRNSVDDLSAYAHHSKKRTIGEADIELLMRRQRFVTDKQSMYSLVEKYLPLQYREQIIPMARSGNKIFRKT